MPSALRRLLAGVGTVVLLVVGIQLFDTSSASAHGNAVGGASVCANGTYTVTWTITNDYALAETASVTGHTPGAGTLSAGSVDLAPNGAGTITESGIPGDSTSASLDVHGVWTDKYTADNSGSLTLGGDCKPGKTPASPSWTNGACENFKVVQPTITIPGDTGVSYALGGTPKAAGVYPVDAGDYTITASSTTFTLSPPVSWSFTLTSVKGDCLTVVTPENPTVSQSVCKAGSHTPTAPTVTATDTAEITYTVKGVVAAGKTVEVDATATAGHKFGALTGGWTKVDDTHATYTLTLHDAPDCTETAVPVNPTVTQSACPGPFTSAALKRAVRHAARPADAAGTTPLPPTLTLPADSASIHYVADPSSGWTAPGTATVTATAQPGYKFDKAGMPAGWTWVSASQATFQVTFADAAVCVLPANPDVTESVCATSGTTPVAPTLTLPTTTGLTYTVSPAGPYAGGQTVTVTATLDAGYQFGSGALPGWTLVSPTVASRDVTFAAAPQCVETTTPGFSNDECKAFVPTTATYTIPNTTGVDYYVDTVLTAPGTYTATDSSTVTVEAKPQAGYTLVGTTSWSHTFTGTPTCTQSQVAAKATFTVQQCVTGSTPKPGTYTIPTSTGVDYTINGTVVQAGTYPAKPGSTVTVVAQAKPGYVLKGTSLWTFTFDKTKQCSDVDSQTASRPPAHSDSAQTASQGPLASTGVHSSSLLTVGAGLLVLGVAITLLAGVSRRRRSDGPRH